MVGGALLLAALTLLPWRDGGATAIQAPRLGLGVAAAVVATAATTWLAIVVLTPGPLVADPRWRIAALWGLANVLAVLKATAGTNGLRVGAWSALVLSAGLTVLAARRAVSASLRAQDLGHA